MIAQPTVAPPEVSINIRWNSGQPTGIPSSTEVGRGGTIAFSTDNQATLLIVCQYKYNEPHGTNAQHSPFESGDLVVQVDKAQRVSRQAKVHPASDLEAYKYTLVLIPDNGAEFQVFDPIIIIR